MTRTVALLTFDRGNFVKVSLLKLRFLCFQYLRKDLGAFEYDDREKEKVKYGFRKKEVKKIYFKNGDIY